MDKTRSTPWCAGPAPGGARSAVMGLAVGSSSCANKAGAQIGPERSRAASSADVDGDCNAVLLAARPRGSSSPALQQDAGNATATAPKH